LPFPQGPGTVKGVCTVQRADLRIRSLKDGQIEGVLQNQVGAGNFSTFVAPDGKTILTHSASDGRLQLWRTPEERGRGSELRQLVWSNGSATCGAFAPDSAFAVTGTSDHQVLVWAMPAKKEIDERLEARVTLIEQALDSGNRQVRIWADLLLTEKQVEEHSDWLKPGLNANMVILPPARQP
jgi:WD40 repeat protein